MSKIITTTYEGPDLDGYSCSVAYAELLRAQGKDAEAHVWGEPLLEVQWLLEKFNIVQVEGAVEESGVSVVLTDASMPDDLPSELQPEQVVEIIDHHKVNEIEKFPNAKVQLEIIGAAATLVAERFKNAGLEPSKESALLLYGGILSNTQNFTGPKTDRDRVMADWLKSIAGVGDEFVREMFEAKSDLSGERLREQMISDFKAMSIHGKNFGIAQLELIGTEQLLNERRDEIEKVLSELKEKNDCEYTFLNIKDLDLAISRIICLENETAELLSGVSDVVWNGRIGTSSKYTLRKQIWVQIDEILSKA